MSKLSLMVLGIVITSVIGCGTTQPLDDQTQVANRAQERLTALVGKDFAKAYSYATPAYRQSVSLDSHKPRFAGARSWTEAVVKNVSCDSDVCDVNTLISYSLPQLKMKNTRPLKERWIRVDGQWWIYHK